MAKHFSLLLKGLSDAFRRVGRIDAFDFNRASFKLFPQPRLAR
jgi:hypothetical protein